MLVFVLVLTLGFVIKNRFSSYNMKAVTESGKNFEDEKKSDEDGENSDIFSENKKTSVIVYVTGEVNKPGIVELSSDLRVKDAVNIAGGFTKDADINLINLAERVEDEAHYIIPKIGEESDENLSNNSRDGKININKADSGELQKLDGIGEALAGRIIEYREKNGKFKTIEDLKQVSGIGEKKFEAIREKVDVK